MNVPTTVAVAIVEQVERVGSYFGFAAVIGLGVLSLLYFAQAREVKRLREWAGRSPERDAELAQRVQSDAQRRVVAQPVAQPRPAAQPGSPQTAAAQQADAARKAAAAVLLEKAGTGQVVGPPGSLDRPAAPAAPPAPGSVPAAAGAPSASAADTAAAASSEPAAPAAPGQTVPPASTVAGAAAAPTAATAGAAAAAAARQAGPPARTPPFANGAGGQDTHESDAARPEPLPDLPRVPRTVTPAASRLSDDDARARRPRLGVMAGAIASVLVVGVVLVLLLTGGSDPPPAENEIGSVTPPPPAASAPTSATRVDRKATQVAVLNGTTQTGLARNVGNRLERSGFTILSVGDNADQQIATTTISYVDGSERAARVVAQIMSVPSAAVQPIDLNTSTAVDPAAKVVVIVGSDRSNTG